MKRFTPIAAAAAALCAVWNVTHAAEPLTANTLRLADGEKSPPATIEQMAWLAGDAVTIYSRSRTGRKARCARRFSAMSAMRACTEPPGPPRGGAACAA